MIVRTAHMRRRSSNCKHLSAHVTEHVLISMQKPSQGSRLLGSFELFWCTWPGYGLLYVREEKMPSLVIPDTQG